MTTILKQPKDSVSLELLELEKKHTSPSIGRDCNLIVDRAEGPFVYTRDGEEYLDFVQGIAVNNVGHRHPKVVEAAKAQIDKLIHLSYGTAFYEPYIRLTTALAEVAPGDLSRVFLANSGAEAVEGALKLSRFYTRRPAIIGFRGSFHGRTMGALTLTASSATYHGRYEPLLPSVYHVPYPYCYRCPYRLEPDTCGVDCFEELENLLAFEVDPEDVAAVVMEPVMGEGGYVPPHPEYVKRLRTLCDRHGILFVADEVQTGFGRTGKMFAIEHFDVVPDIMSLGKGIAAGFPLSAVVAKDEIMGSWKTGAHGSTYGGNPVSCAAALANLEVIREEKLVERAAELGAHMKARFQDMMERFEFIGDVRGLGLMIGIEFVKDRKTKEPNPEVVDRIIEGCFERKLLVHPCGNWKQGLRLMVPLNIPSDLLDRGIDIIEEVMGEIV